MVGAKPHNQKYIPIAKVYKHIIANEFNIKVIQYLETYFKKEYILSDGICYVKVSLYNEFDDKIKIKPEYLFGFLGMLYNPKYIRRINRFAKGVIDRKVMSYDTKKDYNGWSQI